MRWVLWLYLVIGQLPVSVFSQQIYSITGTVEDEKNNPLPGANVLLQDEKHVTVTNKQGNFKISGLQKGWYTLKVSYLGYKPHLDSIFIDEPVRLDLHLERSVQTLQEVVVTDDYAELRKRQEALNVEVVNDDFVKQHLNGSLMTTLERLPGVSAIEIGSGQSKPVIRGLSFNRVVVTENGIKHEGQQWGMEHGLEIDQYAIGRVEVVKGPSSLQHGSDAIGGIISIKQLQIPAKNTVGGEVDLTAKSNNGFLGTSAQLYARGNSLFITARYTRTDFGDARVPADSVDIYSFRAPLHNNRLRNTAGEEENLHLSAGIKGNRFSSRLFFSNLTSENGFFANAHGLEPRNVNTALHDQSSRDIHYPYHKVNHLKITNKTNWRTDNMRIESELGFQHNFRQEWSQYVEHGFMPSVFPENMSFPADLEREFDKKIYSGNARMFYEFTRATVSSGLNVSYQDNAIDGRGFIIPAFRQLQTGMFLYGKYKLNSNSFFDAGVRYDYGNVDVTPYSDWFASPVISENDTVMQPLKRAPELNRRFDALSWSAGFKHHQEHLSLKVNIGKSFRMPIAKELGANGVNYHRFSYEVGDTALSPEISYQLDAGLEWHTSRFAVGISPFVNYFSNYIFLNPTPYHNRLYGNGNQIFQYQESNVLRMGGEIHAHYNILNPLILGFIGEYIYAEQLSGEKKGFTLPFSPPAVALFNLKYNKPSVLIFRHAYVSVDYKIAASQNRIVPPEEKTPGYQLMHFSLGGELPAWGQSISIRFQVHNLFNTNYFNHTSYYRLINLPGQGRNFILNVTIPFSTDLKSVN